MHLLVVVATAFVVVTATQQGDGAQPWSHQRQNFVPNIPYGFPYHQVNTYSEPAGPVPASSNPSLPQGGRTAPGVYTAPVAQLPAQPEPYAQRVRSSLPLMLKLAADAGLVRAAGSSPFGVPQYAVSPDLAADAGGVSELAYRMNAIPVAAVHDVQARPNLKPEDSFSPLLVHHELPTVTQYILQVPIQ